MRLLVVGLASFALAACTQGPQTYRDLDKLGQDYQREASSPPPTADEATAHDACGARRLQNLVGAPADQIDRTALPPNTRVITPDSMVTQDFSATRLNVMVGADGKIASLRCF